MARGLSVGVGVLLVAASLTGCNAPTGPTVPMEAAQDAADPACAETMVRLPMNLNGLPKRSTNAQATSAYGKPAAVLLRCGVPTPEPTTDRCISINGIDWVERTTDNEVYIYTTYGRTPALEVVIDTTKASGEVLTGITTPASYLPKTGGCVGAEDVLGETSVPEPAGTGPANTEPAGSDQPR